MTTIQRFIHAITHTWRMYERLLYPPEHPAYWRVIKSHANYKTTPLTFILTWLVVAVMSTTLWWYLAQFNVPFPIILPIILSTLTSAYVSIWIVEISLTVSRERQQSTYDAVAMTPAGAWGANWAWVTGILHRHDLFTWLDFGRKLLMRFLLLVFVMVIITLVLNNRNEFNYSLFILILEIILVAFVTYADHVQSLVVGVFVALLIPQYIRNVVDVHVWSVFVFLMMQFVTMSVFLMAYLWSSIHVDFAPLLMTLVFLYLLREVEAYGLWLLVSHQLNTD